MARVSEIYELEGNQGTFDFVDVHTDRDTPLFIDPAALRGLNDPWASECASGIQGFFQRVLDQIVADNKNGALTLMAHLNEDNSTHLGYSLRSKGSAVAQGLASELYDQLSNSKAARTGLITDLEDTALLIAGIDVDRISDITTNIIRQQLVQYTQSVCEFYNIPTVNNLAIGRYWNNHTGQWLQEAARLPVNNGPLLLVPKAIVRKKLHLDAGEYYTHYVLEYFKAAEIKAQSPLTFLLKGTGERSAYKKDVAQKQKELHNPDNPGIQKRINADATLRDPAVLENFKKKKAKEPSIYLTHREIADLTVTPPPDLKTLLQAVTEIAPGQSEADNYERKIEALLSTLFYPDLVNPQRQRIIHDGRKRIDIFYTNTAHSGFYEWLGKHHPAANLVCECKNFGKAIKNPEFDQITGRFSPSRGQVGLLIYRGFADKSDVLRRARDAAKDSRGWVIPLDDSDLALLVAEAETTGSASAIGGLIHDRFNYLTN